jgi:hypothetical protein
VSHCLKGKDLLLALVTPSSAWALRWERVFYSSNVQLIFRFNFPYWEKENVEFEHASNCRIILRELAMLKKL